MWASAIVSMSLSAFAAEMARPAVTQPSAENAFGNYAGLLVKIAVPTDETNYGKFADSGHWTVSSYAGHNQVCSMHADGSQNVLESGSEEGQGGGWFHGK